MSPFRPASCRIESGTAFARRGRRGAVPLVLVGARRPSPARRPVRPGLTGDGASVGGSWLSGARALVGAADEDDMMLKVSGGRDVDGMLAINERLVKYYI